MALTIRPAALDDAPVLAEIYAPYVADTAISFEYTPPDAEEFARRMTDISAKYPYLVALQDGKVVGYAYAHAFIDRAAYNHCAELTIYLRTDKRGRGTGARLYNALIDELRTMGIHNVYACIARTDEPDEHLTNASEHFHRKMGFELCGTFPRCGYKFGKYYDMIWMGKFI